nr:HNH endonuclease [Bacillus ectoiniformans]
MAKDYAKAFYNSAAWKKCKDGFMQSKHYICERCNEIALICHHKTYITPENIHDPNITLNWDNLEALCTTCHQHEHFKHGGICSEGLTFDSKGNLIQKG